MKRMSELATEGLRWTQTTERIFALRGADWVVATLFWRDDCGSLDTGETADGVYKLKCFGLLRRQITAYSFASSVQAAILRRASKLRVLVTFSDGRTFAWKPVEVKGGGMAFFDRIGKVVSFRPEGVPRPVQADVEIAPGRLGVEDLALLALLGWHEILLERQDAESILRAMAQAQSFAR